MQCDLEDEDCALLDSKSTKPIQAALEQVLSRAGRCLGSNAYLALGCAAMLVAGSGNIELKDWQVQLGFHQPFLWCIATFVGQSCFLPMWWLKERGEQAVSPPSKPPAPLHVYAIVTAFDLSAVLLINIAYSGLPGSFCQMFKAFKIVCTSCFSCIVLEKRFTPYQHLGISMNILGVGIVALVACGAIESGTGWASPAEASMSLFLAYLSCVIGGLHFVWEEKVMKEYAVDPELLIGMEGVIGTCYAGIIFTFLSFTNVVDAQAAFAELRERKMVLFAFSLFLCTTALLHYSATVVTKHSSAVVRALLDVSRSALIWTVEVSFGWDNFSCFELVGFVTIVSGTLVYAKTIKVPCLTYTGETEGSVVRSSA